MSNDEDDDKKSNTLLFDVDQPEIDLRQRDPCGYYAALAVPLSASGNDIRQAFLTLSQTFHTDKHSQQDAETQRLMSARFQQIQQAYQVLSDERLRAAYDHSGSVGLKRMELIPESVNHKAEVLRILDALQREAELRSIARMINASGTIVAQFSVAHLFQSAKTRSRRSPTPRSHPAPQLPTQWSSSSSTPTPTNTTLQQDEQQQQQQQAEPSPLQQQQAEPSQQQQQPAAESQQIVLKQVLLDGVPTVIAVMPQSMQAQLAQQLQQQGGQVSVAAPTASAPRAALSTSNSSSSMRQVSLLFQCCIPRTMQIMHSFTHAISPTLTAQFQGEASYAPNGTSIAFVSKVRHTPNGISSRALSWRASPGSLRCVFFHSRVLNQLWTLKNKLTILDGTTLLPKYCISLTRKLSLTAELMSTVCWGLHGGYFETTWASVREKGEQTGTILRTAAGELSLTWFRAAPYSFNEGTPSEAKGKLQHTVRSSIDGTTDVGYELWWFKSKLQHFGIGISAVLPWSLIPLRAVVSSNEMRRNKNVCQFRLLYARGEHRISIPVLVFGSERLYHALLWLSVPWTAYRLAALAIRPLRNVVAAREAARNRSRLRAEVEAARDVALREQRALESTVQRKIAAEQRVAGGGLVIMNAQYGVLKPSLAVLGTCYPLTLDVTIPLQSYVNHSKLVLPEGRKDGLVGFYDVDPATKEKKLLKITYWFRGVQHSVVLLEDDAVELPQSSHAESSTRL